MELTNELLSDLISAEADYLGLPIPSGLNLNTIRAKINRKTRLVPLVDGFDYLSACEQDDARDYAFGLAVASVLRSIFTTN